MAEQMTLRGTLQGHGGWVTQIATTPQYPDMVLSASRGKYCRGTDILVAIYVIDSLYLHRLWINESQIIDTHYYIEGNGENERYTKLIDKTRPSNVAQTFHDIHDHVGYTFSIYYISEFLEQ